MSVRILRWLVAIGLVVGVAACSSNQSSSSQASSAPAPAQQNLKPVDEATVGEITGVVKFSGKARPTPVIHMGQDPICIKLNHGQPVHFQDGAVNADGTLPYVFVYVKKGAGQYDWQTPSDPVVLDQKGCMYVPHVMGIMVGQGFKVISSDPTTHNIHVMPTDNRQWNLSQPPGAPPIMKTFARPETMIPVKCNQHPWMKCWIGVVKNPLYAVTGKDGTFTIKGVPPGTYTLGFWTATFGTQEQQVTVAANQTAKANVTFSPSSM